MKEKATIPVRIYPSTHKKLKRRAVIAELTLAQMVDELEKRTVDKKS